MFNADNIEMPSVSHIYHPNRFPASKIAEIIVEATSNVNGVTPVQIPMINIANFKGVKA